jgi:hypothetical protein
MNLITMLLTITLGPGADLSAINARPGDVVQLQPGVYKSFPQPKGATPTGRITIIGSPGTVLPGGALHVPNVTLRGVMVAGDFGCDPGADNDSLQSVAATGSFSHQGGNHCVYDGIMCAGAYWDVGYWRLSTGAPLIGPTILHGRFDHIGEGLATPGAHPFIVWNTDSMEVGWCHFGGTVEATNTQGMEVHYGDYNGYSHDNRRDYVLKRDVHDSWRYRGDTKLKNGSDHNRFVRDTLYLTGPGSTIIYPSSSADCGNPNAVGGYLSECVGAWGSSMGSCVFDASGLAGGSSFSFQGGMTGWSLTNTVIAMNGPALDAFDIHGSIVRNCTLVGSKGPAVKWGDSYGRPIDSLYAAVFANNVVASFDGSAPLVSYAPKLVAAAAFSAFYNVYQNGPLPAMYEYQTRVADPLFVSLKPGAFDPRLRVGSPALTGPWGRVGACGVKP